MAFKKLNLLAWVLGTQGDIAPALALLKEAESRGHDALIFTQSTAYPQVERAGIRVPRLQISGRKAAF